MNHWGGDRERQEAWAQAKLAVRAYARQPSDHNVAKVNWAWLRVRRLAASSADWQIPNRQAARGSRHSQQITETGQRQHRYQVDRAFSHTAPT